MELDVGIAYYLCGIMAVLGLITAAGIFMNRKNKG
jgi:hypothetical protein